MRHRQIIATLDIRRLAVHARMSEFMPLRDRTRGPPLAGNKRRTFQEDAVSRRIIKWPRQYVTDPAKIDAIRQVFRTRFSDVYKNIDVAEVSRAARKNVLFVKLTGEGESYCLNIQGRHRSNRIYGVIEHGFAMLKCHCTCDDFTGRIQGLCKNCI